jgi:hypothetical protein
MLGLRWDGLITDSEPVISIDMDTRNYGVAIESLKSDSAQYHHIDVEEFILGRAD